MTAAAIIVDGIAKRYRIPHPDAPRISDYFRRPRWARKRPRQMDVLALQDVSFDVHEGEVFGIIGRNGAGKSTLLKILSRITAPSAGRAEIGGRVASLLEVGTGFHPDLTGRENVYLNGMLLGMSSRAVDRVFDQICDFAGIGAYIDTPIKRYSTGMQLRLAFAVAAHLAADTMIVDEVLAVGDAEFQAKCTTAMRDAAGRGRTTLFVSHNMAAVENLCTRVLWLRAGRVVRIGAPDEVVREYLADARAAHAETSEYTAAGNGEGTAVHIAHARVLGTCGDAIAQGDDLLVKVHLDVREPVRGLLLSIALSTIDGTLISTQSNRDYRDEWTLEPGAYDVEVHFSDVRLMPRVHTLTLRTSLAFGADVCEHLQDVLSFPVMERNVLGTGLPLLADRGITWFPGRFNIQRSR
jgi:ABC-type polysaccharide/polyol phosphate transport system ATPase subunit